MRHVVKLRKGSKTPLTKISFMMLMQNVFFLLAVVFQHIPYFIEDPNEEKEYFNLDQKFRIKILDKLRDAGGYLLLLDNFIRTRDMHFL